LGELAGRRTPQLDATLTVNRERLARLMDAVRQACGGLRGMRVGLLGLTYKPGTDTLRRSHALALARRLVQAGAEVRAYDPKMVEARPETFGLALCADAYQAAEAADALLVATPWPEFKNLDWNRLRKVMRQPVLIDAHNFMDDRAARSAGWQYRGVGIPQPAALPAQSEAAS